MRSIHKTQEGIHTMNTTDIRKHLHELIDKMEDGQIVKLYRLIQGIFGKAI